MQKISAEGRHLADKRQASDGTRTAQFMKLSRQPREMFHVNHSHTGTSRLQHFLRIARGRLV